MRTEEKIVALIPLRGGSKSIPKKNIRPLLGKPLCAWSLEAAAGCPLIDKVYVSTDSEEIANVVKGLNLGIEIIERPAEFAQDTSSTESVMLHFAAVVDFDWLITIQATSPLTTSEHLTCAIKKTADEKLDSLLTGVRVKRFFWTFDGKPLNYDPAARPRRQDFEGVLMENGAFYITKREILIKDSCRLGGKIGVFEMPEETAIEIDEPEDWVKIENILKRKY